MMDNVKLSKNVVSRWFIVKKFELFLKSMLNHTVKSVSLGRDHSIVIQVTSKYIYPVLYFLRDQTNCQFKVNIDVVAVDSLEGTHRFFLIYNLLSVRFARRLKVITKVKEAGTVLSAATLYASINWSEREVLDFFGVFFVFNKDLRRILTDYGFQGYPLRKDFPLTGYVELYYDDNQKRLIYKPTELTQEYRQFSFKAPRLR